MSMEPAADIAQALCVQFGRTLNQGVFIADLQQGHDDAYVVVPAGGPDPSNWNSGKQVENFQQFDIYCFNRNVKKSYQMGYDARRFLSCLSCLAQTAPNTDYVLKGTRVIGGLTDLGKTAEEKHMTKLTVQITYLATC